MNFRERMPQALKQNPLEMLDYVSKQLLKWGMSYEKDAFEYTDHAFACFSFNSGEEC